jgi:hypothetical protein
MIISSDYLKAITLTVAVSVLLVTAGASAEVEAEAVAAGARVEKIFHYEEGSEVVNALAQNGVTLGEVWPGLYAVGYSGYFGSNLTLFNDTGKVINEYVFDEERPETNRTFFPSANGEYYLQAWGPLVSLDYMGDPPYHTFYNRDAVKLWEDGSTGGMYLGRVLLSPDGETVVYVQADHMHPNPNSEVVFKKANGSIKVEQTVPYLGELFNYTSDGKYFLVSESHSSNRTSDFGTAVFDKEGRLFFFLDPELQADISWGRSRAAVGGGGGYLYQIGFKVERTKTEGRIFISDRLFDKGRLLQIYDSHGNKLRELKVSTNEWGAGISHNGELIAFVPAEPGDELEVAALASGEHVNTVPLDGSRPWFPLITLSDTGDTVCISEMARAGKLSRDWNYWANLYSAQGPLARFEADKLGSFHLSPDGKYVVFCGARTLAVFVISAPE